ncbi:MAG TPA: DsbA family oxidoreductase [Kofleriaceae bacterium]|nr:DsbA family oxidoreductase [Kofleriaceae bacterium]
MTQLRIDVWSDIACPWCYVGKRRLESALQQAGVPDTDVVWHSFELDARAPAVQDTTVPYAERLATKYRCSVAQAEQMIARMTDTAAIDGITMRFDQAKPGNTFDAHRLLHLAHERGKQNELKERLFAAYLTDGQAIGEHATLASVALAAGLAADEVAAVLSSDRYADEVRADEQLAQEIGITGVPFFVIGGRLAVSGAQPANVLADAIKQGNDMLTASEGASCGPEGCD